MSRKYKKSRRSGKCRGALFSKSAAALMLLVAIIAVLACKSLRENGNESPDCNDTAGLWNVDTPSGLPQTMVDYEGFTVSFNPELHVPNYVIWELTGEESAADEVSRSGARFTCDSNVEGCANTYDYRNSGFDRGHMCPAADMKWSQKAMDDCHMLTNIVPQTHQLNGGPWQTVEKNCRKWAQRDSALIIICGPVLTDRLDQRIGDTGVIVPERFFKVVLAPYANPPRGIAFIMNNYDTTGGAQAAATTIDNVEEITGIDFFSSLPDDIEAEVESQANYQLWQRLKTR